MKNEQDYSAIDIALAEDKNDIQLYFEAQSKYQNFKPRRVQ